MMMPQASVFLLITILLKMKALEITVALAADLQEKQLVLDLQSSDGAGGSRTRLQSNQSKR